MSALNHELVSKAINCELVVPMDCRSGKLCVLGKQQGSPASRLATRLNSLLGRSPVSYLTAWRAQVAARRLSAGSETMSGVA
jgi:AraC-like DNA-binding protein